MDIDARIRLLRHKANLLEKFKAKLISNPEEQAIKFTMADSNVLNKFLFLRNYRKGSYLYYFKVDSNKINAILYDELEKYRSDCKNNIKSGAVVKLPPQSRNSASTVIYVGSKVSDVFSRIEQHLGFKSKLTYSLKLIEWFPQDANLTLHLIPVPEEYVDVLEDLEACLCLTKDPLFGKRAE